MSQEQLELAGMSLPTAHSTPAPETDEPWVQALLDDPDASPEDLLRAFCSHEVNDRLRDAALLHPRLAGYDLVRVMASWPANTRDRAASATDNRTVLERWATSPVPYERAVAALNPRCPADLVLALSQDPHPGVRANAISNGHLPKRIRAGRANRDPDPDVRGFALWLMTTTGGFNLLDGCRYALRDKDTDEVIGRVIVHGMSRRVEGLS